MNDSYGNALNANVARGILNLKLSMKRASQDNFSEEESPPNSKKSRSEASASMDSTPKEISKSLYDGFSVFSKWNVGSKYMLQSLIGSGAYGEVALAINKETNEKVAIKRMPKILSNTVDATRILREMYLLRKMNHPNIICLLDVILPESYESFEDLYMVFEHVDTDLFKIILSQQSLSLLHIQAFVYQLLNGMKYLQSVQVIHRDIKPANILLTENCTLKICDFGLARVVAKDRIQCCSSHSCPKCLEKESSTEGVEVIAIPHEKEVVIGGMESGNTRMRDDLSALSPGSVNSTDSKTKKKPPLVKRLTQHVATRWYRAPELILLQPYTSAVDVWAAGCIFAELLSVFEDHIETNEDKPERKVAKNHSLFTGRSANKALFPGGSCFPLSARAGETFDVPLDQLNMIFDVIGTPNAEDISHLGKVKSYLKNIEKKEPLDFNLKWPHAGPAAIDLLKKMFNFVAFRRITVEECLKHEFLAPVRDALASESEAVHIDMDFIEVLASAEEIKRAVYKEILEWNK